MIEVIPEKITVADRIRGMNDIELNAFLYRFKLNACYLFVAQDKLLTPKQQLKVLQTDERLAGVHYSEFSGHFLVPAENEENFNEN